jgi:hypothetical protein
LAGNDVTIRFRDPDLIVISGLLTCFFLSISVQKLLNIFNFRFVEPLGEKFLGVLGILDPQGFRTSARLRNGTSLCQTASFEVSCLFVRRSIGSVDTRLREKAIKGKKSQSRYTVLHACVCAPIQSSATRVSSFVKVTNVMIHAKFSASIGKVWFGLVWFLRRAEFRLLS